MSEEIQPTETGPEPVPYGVYAIDRSSPTINLRGISKETYGWLWVLKEAGYTMTEMAAEYNKVLKPIKVGTRSRKIGLLSKEFEAYKADQPQRGLIDEQGR